MNSQKIGRKVLSKKPKKATLWLDKPILDKLEEIPEGERSTIIRMALRHWFGISTHGKPVEPNGVKSDEA